MQEGDYTYQLTVTDTIGQQATAQVTVIVQPGKFQLEVQALRLAVPFTLGEEEGLGSELKEGGCGRYQSIEPLAFLLS